MGRLVDLFVTYRFIKLLVTPFDKQDAYKFGIIDEKGYRTEKPVETADEKSSYTILHKLIFNIKRLMSKVPGLGSRLGTYAAALFLLKDTFKENTEFHDIEKALMEELLKNENSIDTSTDISEDYFGGFIPSGKYRLRTNILLSDFEKVTNTNDVIVFEEKASPIDNVLGVDIYEGIHLKTNQKIYVSLDDIKVIAK